MWSQLTVAIFGASMKKILTLLGLSSLVLLNWAALDDITTGTEPSYGPEYAVVASTLLLAVLAGWRAVRGR